MLRKFVFEEEEPLVVGYYNTFVVKIWCDDSGEMIRGHVQRVTSTKEHIYFSSLEDLTDFIVRHLDLSPNNYVTGDRIQDRLSLLNEGIGDVNQDE